jgi:two-component system sensor histidine kinase YesM
LRSIREYLESKQNDVYTKSIGIKNVNERLKLYYGQEYGISLTSQRSIGTEVILLLPLNKNGGRA